VSGEAVGALALTEPQAGSDAVALRTRAERRGDHYLLNGSKQFITNGPVADWLLVYAKTSTGARGPHGISAFHRLEQGDPGLLRFAKRLDKMGMRGSPTGELVVPGRARFRSRAARRERAQRGGRDHDERAQRRARRARSAIPVGIMAECLERSLEYARARGSSSARPIGRFELVQSKLADMYARLLEAARLLLVTAALDSVGQTGAAIRCECGVP
jgi:isovaleryl-CoA dehydrogenase